MKFLSSFTTISFLLARGLAVPTSNEIRAISTGPVYKISPVWGGSVLVDPTAGWKSVTGTFVVPTPSSPVAGDTTNSYGASVWVGIDGTPGSTATCTNSALMQIGLYLKYIKGVVGVSAWYEWYPLPATDIPSTAFAASPGDSITLTVTATSSTSGTGTLVNHKTGKFYSHTWTNQAHALCGIDAEWIVEDYNNGTQVPFVNFGTVAWTSASATAANGSSYGPAAAGAQVWNILHNGSFYTDCAVGTSTTTCSYLSH